MEDIFFEKFVELESFENNFFLNKFTNYFFPEIEKETWEVQIIAPFLNLNDFYKEDFLAAYGILANYSQENKMPLEIFEIILSFFYNLYNGDRELIGLSIGNLKDIKMAWIDNCDNIENNIVEAYKYSFPKQATVPFEFNINTKLIVSIENNIYVIYLIKD